MYVEPAPAGEEGYFYTVIFTHEDGGTPTDRLMARWGRSTDIEYVYGIRRSGSGSAAVEEYQGSKHEILPFRGTREGRHPLLWVVTDNNMVSDTGPEDAVRFAPAPALVGGKWFNIACGACSSGCSCSSVSEVVLPYPVASIEAVRVDGVVLDPSAYRVDDWRLLVRLDGGEWPRCNDLNLADTEEGTWSVTAQYGTEVPRLGQLAAGQLATQIAKACAGVSGCLLPSTTVRQVQRQGVTKTFFDDTAFGAATSAGILAGLAAAVVAVGVRFRRGHGDERQQIKWIMYGGLLTVVAVATAFFEPTGLLGLVLALPLLAMPLTIGIAILRYRLYDIDVIVHRTLVYTTVTAVLAATYAGGVLVLQVALSPITGSGALAVAASTLLVAALFHPMRRRIQSVVDRRFYRSRYDAARTLEAFSARLRNEVDLDRLTDELRTSIAGALQPAAVGVWLRDGRADER